MSADNFIAVWERDGDWMVAHGMMPSIETDERLAAFKAGARALSYPTRASALEAAHDWLRREMIVEYGVIEL